MSKHLSESGGSTKDYFNTATIFTIGLVNFINQVLEGKDLIDRLYLTLPLILLSILVYNNYTSKTTKAIIFTIFGALYQVFAIPDSSYIGSTIFFSLAYMQFPNIRFGVFTISIALISVIIKTTESEHTPSQTIGIMTAFVFLLGNIYLEIEKYKNYIECQKIKHEEEIESINKRHEEEIESIKEELNKALKGEIQPIKNIDIINITQEEKGILRYFCKSYNYDKIQQIMGLNISPNTVRRKITSIKKENKDRILRGRKDVVNVNDAHFGTWLNEKV